MGLARGAHAARSDDALGPAAAAIPPADAVVWEPMSRRRRLYVLVAAALVAGCLLNAVAYFHAWSMLHFAGAGERTKPPEQLGWYAKAKVLLVGIDLPRPRNRDVPADLASSFTTHRFSTADHVELEAWWAAHAAERGVVLLFHGYAGTRSALLDEARAFRSLGFSTLLVDLRGHGGSSGDWTSIGYYEAADVAAAVAYVRRDLARASPLVLYGQSMGAVSIVRAVATGPAVASAVIVEGLYDEMLNAIRNRFRAMGLPPFPLAELLGFWGGVQMGFPAHRHNPSDYAGDVAVPVLMLHGADDPRATREQARRVFDRLGGPKRFVEFPGARHGSLYRVAPERWIEAVEPFLASVTGPGPPRP
jgi:alpha-beta hydrolase superfamily lysophospholipase